MPAPFSASEKAEIEIALLTVGLEHFVRHGIRRARIDDICKDVGISKGSFYAFFPSKEDLFIAIGDARRAEHMAELFAMLDNMEGDERTRVGRLFDSIVKLMETNALMQVMSDQGEMARLKRKITPERLTNDQEVGDAFYRKVAEVWNEKGFGASLEASVLADIMTVVAALTLQQKIFPAEPYESAKALLREMVVARLAGD